MKNTISLVFLLVLSFVLKANNQENQSISIQFTTESDIDLLQLFRIERGAKTIVDEFTLKAGEVRTFNDTCVEAFYLVKYNKAYTKIFASEERKVSLNIGERGVIVVKPSKENKFLKQWYDTSEHVRNLSVNYRNKYIKEIVQLTPYYNAQRQFEKDAQNFSRKLKGFRKSPFFSEAMGALINAEINYYKLYNPQMPVIKASIKKLPDDLYRTIISEERLTNPVLLDVFEYTIQYVHLYGAWNQRKDFRDAKPVVDYVKANEVKVAYLVYFARKSKNGSGLKRIETKYLDLFQSPDAMAQLEELRKAYQLMKDNAKFSKIELKTLDKELVKLSEFTGKLLVVDVWATWCAPCMKKRPHFEALAHELKDEEVTFIAISLDKSDMSWAKVVNGSACIELRDCNKDFANAFGITSIPHFLIFDKNGELLDSPAASPGAGMKESIMKYLAM